MSTHTARARLERLQRKSRGILCPACRARAGRIILAGLPLKAHTPDTAPVYASRTLPEPCAECGREPITVSMRGLVKIDTMKGEAA